MEGAASLALDRALLDAPSGALEAAVAGTDEHEACERLGSAIERFGADEPTRRARLCGS